MEIRNRDQHPWLLSIVYGSPNLTLRKFQWQALHCNKLDLSKPWLVAGDFNAITSGHETSYPGNLDNRRCSLFNEWISNHQLIDMGFSWPGFTYTRGLSTSTFKGARLDRALCNADWKLRFEGALVTHLPKLNSDHTPLLISLEGDNTTPLKAEFRFQVAWLTHLNIKEVVSSLWRVQASFGESPEGLSTRNKECFGNIFQNKKRLWARIAGVQRDLAKYRSNKLLELEKKLQGDLDLVLKHEGSNSLVKIG